jgi:hypothetical protein
MSLMPFVILWAVSGVAVLGLALYRKVLTFHGDDEFVHLAQGEERLIPQQVALGNKLEIIDRWGKGLTIFTAALGVAIIGVVLFQAWEASLLIK